MSELFFSGALGLCHRGAAPDPRHYSLGDGVPTPHHALDLHVPWGILIGGEELHNNHHAFPRNSIAMNIRPLHDRVLVKRIEEERKTASGRVIPDTAAEKPDQGEIVFGKYSGQIVRVKGDELLVMREEAIMGVVEGR